MNCLRCEIIRAKLKAKLLYSVGMHPIYIAKKLTMQYGVEYYLVRGVGMGAERRLFRKSSLPPYKPIEIARFGYE